MIVDEDHLLQLERDALERGPRAAGCLAGENVGSRRERMMAIRWRARFAAIASRSTWRQIQREQRSSA